MNDLKNKVESVLRDVPATRNSDRLLSVRLWKKYYPGAFTEDKKYIKVDALRYLPTQASIQRIRAMIQHDEGKYPPTCSSIAYARNMSRKSWESVVKNADYAK